MSLPFGSMRVFISNYVFYSFGFILRYFFRFLHLGDTKKEINIQQSQQLNDGNFHDSKMDGFSEELANFLFWSEEFHERETEYSVFMDTIHEGKTEYSVLKENHSDFHEESVKTVLCKNSDSKEIESHIQLHVDGIVREKEDGLVFVESKYANFVVPEDSKENEGEGEDFVIMETDPNVHETETKKFLSMDNSYDLCNDNKKIEEEIGEISIDENETECSVFMENVSVANQDDDIKGSEEDATTSGKLQDIIKESMRMFWEFVRADKDNGNVICKHIGFDLKDPAISGLLVDIKTQLQKKDRKLKDIVRTGNCIVKKFQKHHEDQLDHEQLVAQVGLKLISRVVNMSQLRKDQVLWCSEKLHRIKFLSRKIVHVEPSFLLFPC